MAGAIIENLSGRKLGILIVFLMSCQVVCFLVGALIGEGTLGITRNSNASAAYKQRHRWEHPSPLSSATALGGCHASFSPPPASMYRFMSPGLRDGKGRSWDEWGRKGECGWLGGEDGRRAEGCTWCPVCQLGVLGSKQWLACLFLPPLPWSSLPHVEL